MDALKIGDRVKCTKKNSILAGMTGTVVEHRTSTSSPEIVNVRWDQYGYRTKTDYHYMRREDEVAAYLSEIELAIDLLKSKGYKVEKPKWKSINVLCQGERINKAIILDNRVQIWRGGDFYGSIDFVSIDGIAAAVAEARKFAEENKENVT